MTAFDKRHGRRKPPLGQHFLRDSVASGKIVEALSLVPDDAVVEIGPGRGELTRLLAAKAGSLTAIELDRELAAVLAAEFAGAPSVEIVKGDILKIDLGAMAAGKKRRLQVVGNLPYYITSPILLHLFRYADVVDRAVVMMQRELAERLTASPGNSEYGLLSATAGMHAKVEKLFSLPPGAFSPPPAVSSAVVRLVMRKRFEELHVEREEFLGFLRQIFAQKRKTLVNNLVAAGFEPDRVRGSMDRCGLDRMMRAEALPLEQTAKLYQELQAASSF